MFSFTMSYLMMLNYVKKSFKDLKILATIKFIMVSQLEIGGFDECFLNELPDDFVCPICLLAIREPVQTECGHRFCFSCLEETKKS